MIGGDGTARFIHTADWHLGRPLASVRLTDDQAYALEGLCDLVAEVRPDAVLISGDVYDRSVPPPEAVELLDDTLTRIAGLGAAVCVVAGNHDSPERIGFGARLLAPSGVHMAGPLTADVASVALPTDEGPVRLWLLPYADPSVVRFVLDDDALRGHDEAVAAMLARVRAAFRPGERNVLIAHEFVAGGVETADSERPLTVGGTAQVACERFDGFDYVALGHLHRPQAPGPGLRYAGSLLKYSVAEAEHSKSVSVVELGAAGSASRVEEVALPVRRDVRVVSGVLDAIVADAPPQGRDDYVFALLQDTGPLYDPMAALRGVWPNCIGFRRDRELDLAQGQPSLDAAQLRSRDVTALFSGFFQHVCGEDLTQTQRDTFVAIADAAASEGED